MSTLIEAPRTSTLPAGAALVREDGLLTGVRRHCPDHHAPQCPCVASAPDGRMVFWCGPGNHHFTAHPGVADSR